MPASRSSSTSGHLMRVSSTRRHRPGLWDYVSSTIRDLFRHDDPRSIFNQPAETPQVLEEEPIPSTLEIAPAAVVQPNIAPQVPVIQQPVLPGPPPLAPPVPISLHDLHRTFLPGHGAGADARSNCPRNVPVAQVPPVSVAAPSDRPRRRAPLQRHGAFHERDRPFWNAGSGHEPPIVYGRSPATLPENQLWDPSWGPVPHLSVITALSNGPPTPQQVLNYLNGHFRLNRRAYSMALDILFPQPREVPVERGIPVYHRVLETSRWRRDHPDWEGGIVPVDREVGPVRADDAADSQAGSDDEDSNDDVFTPRERRAIRTRVAWLLPGAYRAHLAAEHVSGASSGSASSSGSDESFGVSSSSSSGTESSSSSEHTSSSDSSSSSSSSGSSSRNSSSSSPRKRRHEEDDASDASSSITLSEGRSSDRPSTRRRLDSDTQALPAPPGSFPTSANTHPLHAPRTEDRPRKERRQLMRRHRQLLPPIGPPGVRIGGPAIASTSHSQPRDSMSGVVDAHPGRVAHVPAQPVAGSSGEGDREVVVEVPLRRSPKRSRDADTSETSPSQRDGEERDKEDKRKKKRSRKD